MPINQAFLGEFDMEMATTRKYLERVPESKFDWAPLDKNEGVVKAHMWCAVFFAPRNRQRV